VASVVAQLEEFGPARVGPGTAPPMGEAEAVAWCAALARGHYENFSVLSSLVPVRLRPDFAAVYAFCRWADDLGDEAGAPGEERLRLLAWWRGELEACYAGAPRHPVFVALRPAVARHGIPARPFDDLIRAFELDQSRSRWETWDDLVGYCSLSADPVGRIVLALFGLATPERVALSDRVCTALQVVNHVQDVRRDLLERGRVYLPAEFTRGIPDFEARLAAAARAGHAPDHAFLGEYRAAVRPVVDRCHALFAEGRALLPTLGDEALPVVRLFVEGGERVLRAIEDWNLDTCIHRPRLARSTKALLVARAWWDVSAPRWARTPSGRAAAGGPPAASGAAR
jgi:squalene synthase HpnC